MKICPRCNTQLEDSAVYCPNCGTQFVPDATVSQHPVPLQNLADHTAEFDPQDISDNKVFAMLPYLMSILGIVIAVLAAKDSKFTMFHVRQALKIQVTEILLGFIAAFGAILLLIPTIAALVCIAILFVVQIICFFRVCSGKAIEAPIVKNLSFLK